MATKVRAPEVRTPLISTTWLAELRKELDGEVAYPIGDARRRGAAG